MTPAEMARAECANWVSGACLWEHIAGFHARDLGDGIQEVYQVDWDRKCLVEKGYRCSHFEDNVLPLRLYPERPNRAQLAEAGQAYIFRHELISEEGGRPVRLCPDCQTEQLAPRKRYCPKCGQKRQRASERRSRNRHAGGDARVNGA